MKKFLTITLLFALLVTSCNKTDQTATSDSIGNATRYIKVMTYQELEEKLLVDDTMYSYYNNFFHLFFFHNYT